MGKAQKIIWSLAIAAVFAFVFSYEFDSKLNLNGDNAQYLGLAENIASGNGYSQMNYLGELVPASHFPPGYSAILALFMKLGINSLIFFKILNGLFLVASLLILFYLTDRITGNRALAFSAVLLAVFSPQTMSFATIVMSEMSYMFFVILGFLFLYRYTLGDTSKFYRSPAFWLAIVAIAVSYYIRTVAMAAIVAVLVFFAFRKEWKQLFVSLGGIVALLLPWSLRNAANGIESRYFGTIMTVNPWRPEQGTISSFGELVEKMIANFDETVIKGFKEILFPFIQTDPSSGSGFLAVIFGLLIVAVVFYGAWNMGRLRWLFIVYLLGNIGLFMLWHGGNGTRYVVPVALVLFVCFWTGLYYLVMRFVLKKEGLLGTWLPLAFLIMIIPAWGPMKAQAEISKQPYPPAYVNYFTIANQLNDQVPEGTVVIARKPELFIYYAPDIIAVNYIYSQDSDEVIRDLIRKNADYVVLEQLGYSSTSLYLLPAIEKDPELFPVVWHLPDPDTYLLKFEYEKAEQMLLSRGSATDPSSGE